MRRPAAGLKAWHLMAAVAIAAVSFAAARAETAPGAAITIVGACVCCLACKRYSESVAPYRAAGEAIGTARKAGLLLAAATLAATVIGISDLAFLGGYYGYMEVAASTHVSSHWTPYDDPGYMVEGMAIGTILALLVASSLRRTAWSRDATKGPRRWLNLWPVALTALLVAQEMRERYSFCRMMADDHSGPEARADGPENAAAHAWLNRWYERAAIRPWLPVHPEHVPPGL